MSASEIPAAVVEKERKFRIEQAMESGKPKEIAEKLFVRPRPVEFHRNNLLLKTGARNAAGLVVYAMTKGIYTP